MNHTEVQLVTLQREHAVAEQKRADDMGYIRAELESLRRERQSDAELLRADLANLRRETDMSAKHMRKEMRFHMYGAAILTVIGQCVPPAFTALLEHLMKR